jgi:sulfite reductase (NADPH) flavoprotein alpha-component
MNTIIPVLPENAPFTPEQRAYLNGFLAGLYSYTTVPGAGAAPTPASRPMQPLSILFGSQTGTAEKLAKAVSKEAGKHGFAPTIHDLAKYPPAQLASEQYLLVITSTYGDGEPPDNAKGFWEFLSGGSAPTLEQVRFSVLSLGDSNYPKFCQFGKDVDTKLAALGAKCVSPRVDCDVDYEEPFGKWLTSAVPALAQAAGAASSSSSSSSSSSAESAPAEPKYSKKNPFPAKLVTNRTLNAPGSGKDVRHFEIDLSGSDLRYEAGDALGVFPTNDPLLADEIILALGAKPDDAVPGKDGAAVALRDALIGHYDINRIPQPFLKALADRSGDATLQSLLAPEANGTLGKFTYGREIIDLLLGHPAAKFSTAEFIALLKKLQPRLYSISSSPKAHPGQVHLTVGVVRYESHGRKRGGVCSTFLAERAGSSSVPVFVHENKAFRPPDGDKPLIMCGPGTGIAPFRAYIEERKATGAKGRNWLFFGDQKSTTDFLYREELEAFQRDGLLNRLDLAWSRDQAEKVYVQQRMLENAKELFAWLEDGAGFYVCGDASRMAKDVDLALHQIVERAGGKTPEQAADYIKKLKAEKRYQRDVY